MVMETSEDEGGCLVFFASAFISALLIGFGFWLGHGDIISKNKIEPTVRIEIMDGKADTTFIYKRQ